MPSRHNPVLPGARAKAAMPFKVGARVVMKCCPQAHPGRVTGSRRGKVLVYWDDLNITARHKPDSLLLAGEILSEVGDEATK
jgi:hypothetical protein